MTQNEIIDMARKSGFRKPNDNRLQYFAQLVAAATRKATLEEMIYAHPTTAIEKAVAIEREACAKECEHTALRMGSEWMAQHCAEAIRARGQQ